MAAPNGTRPAAGGVAAASAVRGGHPGLSKPTSAGAPTTPTKAASARASAGPGGVAAATAVAAAKAGAAGAPKRTQRRHLFWYKSRTELDLLFKNHRLFVQRTGNNPPLRVVETNILELSRRVLRIHSRCALRVQTAWRGALARVLVGLLVAERGRLLSMRVSAAIRIQRFVRCAAAWRLVRAVRARRHAGRMLRGLREETQARRGAAEARVLKAASMVHYQHDVASAVMGKLTGVWHACVEGSLWL